MEDPACLKKAKKLEIPVNYISGEEAETMAQDMYKSFGELFKSDPALKKLVKKKKKKKKKN